MTSAPTPATEAPKGIDVARVTAWFAGRTRPRRRRRSRSSSSPAATRTSPSGSPTPPGHACVLRRPPLGHVLATAHDMGREHRIISALGADRRARCAPVLGLCDRRGGQRRAVLRHGLRRRPRPARRGRGRRRSTPTARARAGEPIADVLARIHAVDLDAVGLGDLGRKEGYIERQLKRWYGQWQESKTRDLPVVDEVHDALAARIPEQGPAAIVHGDYRLDNCMVGDDGTIAAVLDWELCTLGDPLADVGLLLVYWTEPRRRAPGPARRPPPRSPGSPTGPSWSSATPSRVGPRRLARSTSTSPSATGSWPASSRACTPATPAAPWARRRASRASPTRSSCWPTRPRHVESLPRLSRLVRHRPPAHRREAHMALYELLEQPDLDEPGARARPRRLDRRRPGRRRRGRRCCATRSTRSRSPRFDADELLDHRARRPIMHLVDGVLRGLTWPTIELRAATDVDGNDAAAARRRRARPRCGTVHRRRRRPGARLRRPPVRRPRRLPGAGPPHPAAPAGVHGVDAAAGRASASCGRRSTSPAACRPPSSGAADDRASRRLGLWAQVPHYAVGACRTRPAAWP